MSKRIKYSPALIERFGNFFKEAPNEGCWLWQGARAKGYGVIRIEGHNEGAHRVMWELVNGPVPEGLFVLHKCDVRACVNPAHLFVGNTYDNSIDCRNKKRVAGQKLSIEDVKAIREAWKNGMTKYALAEQYGMHHRSIWQLLVGDTWKEL